MSEIIFYDGHCGLCHRFVRFVIAEDKSGKLFRFAPLDSEVFRKAVAESKRAHLPDSIVLLSSEGDLKIRSAAILHVLRQLGGLWRAIATIAGIIPSVLLDVIYDGIARVRLRLFKKPEDVCPVVPAHLRNRFL
jgi:predicted DCC family thiol-disulfide oxidoreductase YuxK